MGAAIGLVLAAISLRIALLNLELRLLHYLFSRTEPEVHKVYEWTYNIQKNLEQLMKALDMLKDIEVEYKKYEPTPAVTPAERLATRTQKFINEDPGLAEYGRLQEMKRGNIIEAAKVIWEESKEHIINPVADGVKKGFEYAKEKIGSIFGGGQKEPNPYYQPQFYGEYKDYRDVPGMAETTKLPPGLTATGMTPEAYADLIIAAVPDAVKRAQEAKAKTPAEKKPEEAGPSDTQEILAALQEMMNSLPAAVVAVIPGAAKNASEQPEKAPTGGPDSSAAPVIAELAKNKEILMNQLIQNAAATTETRNAVATVDERVKNIAALLDEHARKMFRQNYESSWTKPTDMADTRDRHNITIRGLKNYR